MTSSGMRARILRAFVLFGTTLVVVYAVLVFAAMQRLEDNIFIQRLDRRADQVAAQIESGGAGPGVHEPAPFDAFHAYVGVDNLPPDLRARIGDWPVGDHEFHDDLLVTNRNEHFVAIRTLDGVDERLFVVYDAVAYASVETWWTPIVWVFAGGALLVLVLGLPLGRRLADQLAAPLAELAEIVETSSPDEIAARLGERGAAGEVGVLREALRRSMTRIAAFVERERRFTRNASHELRTPLTVIRGATDLLTRQLSHDPRALGRLGRIDRSVEHMHELIEAFLALAREDEAASGERCDLESLLADIVERVQPADGDGVRIDVRVAGSSTVQAPATIIASTIQNLLANAVQLTPTGTVEVVLDGSRLEIVDRGPGLPGGGSEEITSPFVSHRRGGVGLGLAIVREVCERYGWSLAFEPVDDGGERSGTRTVLDFAVSGATAEPDAERASADRVATDRVA